MAVDDRVLGHGTAVAGVAAGNGRGSVSRRNRGIAAESDLIIVKLAGRDDGFPRTTEVMEGLDMFCVRRSDCSSRSQST